MLLHRTKLNSTKFIESKRKNVFTNVFIEFLFIQRAYPKTEQSMKRQKTPQEKKAESYAFDRRDSYGGNNKSSRKSVPRGKTRVNRNYRHTVRQKLVLSGTELSEELADNIDVEARNIQRGRFWKCPDTPLREVVQAKLERRAKLEQKAFRLWQERT